MSKLLAPGSLQATAATGEGKTAVKEEARRATAR
jgi:hypothetical protein